MIDPDQKENERRRLETIWPELIKRVLEAGVVKLSEGPENVRQFVSELRLPKEALALLLAQIDDTKAGLQRAVSRELRDFLEKANLSEELARVLTKLTLEIKTEVRFVPNEGHSQGSSPKVKSDVAVKRTGQAPESAKQQAEPEPRSGQASANTIEEEQ